jgi:membrane-bound lytic murein transglycosylase D
VVLTGNESHRDLSTIEYAYSQYEFNKPKKQQKRNYETQYAGLGVNSGNLWEIAPTLYKLNLFNYRPRVKREIQYLALNSAFIVRSSNRARPYFYHILNRVLKNGMPAEIALLPFIESGFNPKAISSANAQGLWQFIPSTAKHFGLRNSPFYDDRRDIIASTEAAITYLKQLNKQFKGDWLLTLAAYNCGQYCVKKAQLKNKKMGKMTDFWSLQLPLETRKYVPKFLAINHIMKNSSRFKLKLPPLENKKYFTAIKLNQALSFSNIAKLANISNKQLVALNPGFKQHRTSSDQHTRILLPKGHVHRFRQNLNSYKSSIASYTSALIYSL